MHTNIVATVEFLPHSALAVSLIVMVVLMMMLMLHLFVVCAIPIKAPYSTYNTRHLLAHQGPQNKKYICAYVCAYVRVYPESE